MFSNRKIILIILLLIAVCISAYTLIVYIPSKLAEKSYDGAKQIGRDISKIFQFTPEITVNNVVVLQQQSAILELATLSQKFQHQYHWTNQWMRSTKKIKITGSFEAKAGFDLKQKFSISLDDDKAIVVFPEPQLLSIESLSDMKFEDENGIWNWVNQEDRAKAVNAFHADARRYAEQAAFIQDVKTKTEAQLREILQAHAATVEFRYTEPIRKNL